MNKRLNLWICCMVLFSNFVNSQPTSEIINLNWAMKYCPVYVENSNQTKEIPSFDGAIYTFESKIFPIYATVIPVSQYGKYRVSIVNPIWENANTAEIALWETMNLEIPDPITRSRITRKKPEILYQFSPIRKNEFGIWEKLIRFELSAQFESAIAASGRGLTYTEESVLASGDIYKIKVTQDGIYKIDRNLLDDLGISSSAPINQFRIFGNGAGLLPEIAGADRPDDLQPIPTEIHDINGNGIFDNNDYVIFYGQGPNQWQWKNITKYSYEINIYDDANYYFISFDKGASLEIPLVDNNGLIDNYQSTTCDYLWIQEDEKQLFLYGGKEWYSDVYNVGTEKNISINLPNFVSGSEVTAKLSCIARAFSTSSSFTLKESNENIISLSIGTTSGGYESDYALSNTGQANFIPSDASLNFVVKYYNSSGQGQGWLDYLMVTAKQQIKLSTGQLHIRDQSSVGVNNVSSFTIANSNMNTRIWNVTNPYQIEEYIISNGQFKSHTNTFQTFVLFDQSQYLAPEAIGKQANQNLHAVDFPNMVIVTPDLFYDEAERLAELHRAEGLHVQITPIDQIYQEFAGGKKDISAIRNYMKMFYDRAGSDETKMPDYLVLFGDGSYDYKNITVDESVNTNYIPTYQSPNSIDPIESYTSDDYFALLDDSEGFDLDDSQNTLELAVGRFPVSNVEDAKAMVDKVYNYYSDNSKGEWTNNITFIADDEDSNLHFNHAEHHANYLKDNFPLYNIDKIYLDAYPQVSSATGATYPDVVQAINNKIFNGSLIMNYVGHGGERGLAHEGILGVNQLVNWTNIDKLPVFITATCSFSRYDDPNKTSAGELLVTSAQGGAIANMTTVRLVYASSNETMNRDFLHSLFAIGQDDLSRLGIASRNAKNAPGSSATGDNNRKFTLLGDPALKLIHPTYKVATTSIQNAAGEPTDTLKAQAFLTIKGQIVNTQNQPITDFNGEIISTVFDKELENYTKGQDPGSNIAPYKIQKNTLFKGRATVTNGQFQFNFVVPKDIAINIGNGKISYFSYDNDRIAGDADTTIQVGDIQPLAIPDSIGPQIKIYMNDDKFVFGGITNQNPVLVTKVTDQSGINTLGTGIGHDLVAILDEDEQNAIVLNDYYKSNLNNFTEGEIRYPLSDLSPGRHHISVKAWDAINNSGENFTEFVVENDAVMALSHIMNYPNPFTDHTSFWFEHNKPGQELKVRIQIFSISGRLIRTLERYITAVGNRVTDMDWDGTDDFGQKIGRGVYVYRLSVSSNTTEIASKLEKLVILK